MMKLRYRLSKPNQIPEEDLQHVIDVLKSGDFYRYNTASDKYSEVDLLEKAVTDYTGAKYALAVNSCGAGTYIAMKTLGVNTGDKVLMSAFTYTAVPSAIVHAGAQPVLVGCNEDYTIDIEDLKSKISYETKGFVISHMRGHISNMHDVKEICQENNIWLIEDCAHTYGGFYKETHTGLFGDVGIFSVQSHKLINAGEGGIMITNREDVLAKAVLYAGSQEKFWKKHYCKTDLTNGQELNIPNVSMRMSNVTAAIARVQLVHMDAWRKQYNEKFCQLKEILKQNDYIKIVDDIDGVERCIDTVQFVIKNCSAEQMDLFTVKLEQKGIDVKRFYSATNPRYYKNWKYIEGIDEVELPKTDEILKVSFDLRFPLWLLPEEVSYIGHCLNKTIDEIMKNKV